MSEKQNESKDPFRPLIFGEALFDHFPDGSRVLGGAPFNVAWHLKGFGANPLTVTSVGQDREGEEILERMDRWGMDTSGVQEHPSRPTGRVTAHLEDGNPSYDIEARQAYDAIMTEGLPRRPVLEGCDLLYHGTLALREPTSYNSLVYLRGNWPLPTLVDVNLRAPWWTRGKVLERLKGVSWVKLNQEELELLGRFSTQDPAALEEPGSRFREEHEINTLVVTLGQEGSLALTSHGSIRQGARKVGDGVDSVGAGDAFAAVLLLGIHLGWSVEVILRRASEFAGDICKIRGATSHDPELYARHLRSWGHAT